MKLLIQDWASEYWYGLIMWKNSGGSDPIKEAFVVPIVSGQPSTPYGPPINVSVSVPNELGWSDTVVDDSPLENVVRIHFSGMWGHSHAGTIKLLFDR